MKRIPILFILVVILSTCKKDVNQNQLALESYEQLVLEKIEGLATGNNGLKIKDQQVFWGRDSANQTLLSEISADKLFFYFSEKTCTPCIEHTIELIAKYFPDYSENNNKVIFISPDCLFRFRENCYGKKLLVFEDTLLGIPLEKENVPFVFTLSKDMEISNLHIVNKNDFAITDNYLKKISASFY